MPIDEFLLVPNDMGLSSGNGLLHLPSHNSENSGAISEKGDTATMPKEKNSRNEAFHATDVNTKIACLNCREKKLKCDKVMPSCSRCLKKGIECVYVQHKKTGPKPNSANSRSKKPASDLASRANSTCKNPDKTLGPLDEPKPADNNSELGVSIGQGSSPSCKKKIKVANGQVDPPANVAYDTEYSGKHKQSRNLINGVITSRTGSLQSAQQSPASVNMNSPMQMQYQLQTSLPQLAFDNPNSATTCSTTSTANTTRAAAASPLDVAVSPEMATATTVASLNGTYLKPNQSQIRTHRTGKKEDVRHGQSSASNSISVPSSLPPYRMVAMHKDDYILHRSHNKVPDPVSSVPPQPQVQHHQTKLQYVDNNTRLPLNNIMNPLGLPNNYLLNNNPVVQSNVPSLRNNDNSKFSDIKAIDNNTIPPTHANLKYNTIKAGNLNRNPHAHRFKSNIQQASNIRSGDRDNLLKSQLFLNKDTTPAAIPDSNSSSTFNTSLKNIANKSFEEILGLSKLNLTMQDIDKFHAFYFNSNVRIFKYSISRYYNTFVKEPKQILHYSYMIWTVACFYLNEYEYKVDEMYQAALVQMNDYWESTRDSFHADVLTYLHALCLKSQFEFLSGREMRAALTVSSSIRVTQMYGYDQIDLSPTTLGSPAIFFRSFTLSPEHIQTTNTLLQDDDLDLEIPLVEERRRVLWEVYAIDKWSSLVTGLPCALSVDSLSVIFTKLPSPTTFLPLNNDTEITESENEQNSYYLHEAMQKLDNNQVLLDINSSSSKILLLTISENIIKWCKMFLNLVELQTLKVPSCIHSIRNKVDELVRNFESMHNNLLFFDLTTEPLMNIVITNTLTLLYQSVLIKFSSLFDIQIKEDPKGTTICEEEIALFKDILNEVASMSEKLILRFIKKPNMEIHLKKAPVFIVFINSIKSLFQCIAFIFRFNSIIKIDEERKKSLLDTLNTTASVINSMPGKTPIVEKTKKIINNGQELLDHSPYLLSFFDSFFDSATTY